MVRISSKCPPGVICVSPGLITFAVIAIGIAGVFLFLAKSPGTIQQLQQISPALSAAPAPSPQPIQIRVDAGGDDRYTRAPKPERDWLARPDLSSIWNSPAATLPAIATRGIPESYQSMGVISIGDGEVLPLYGRRTASRSDRFQYYTRTDTYNPVQLPLQHKRRDCQDDVGCEELFDGETVRIPASGKEGKVSIYRFSGPQYIPVV